MSSPLNLLLTCILLSVSVGNSLAQTGLADAVAGFTTGLTNGLTQSLTQGLQGMTNQGFGGQMPYQGYNNPMQMQMPGQYPNQMMLPNNGFQQMIPPNGQYNQGFGGLPGTNGFGAPMMPQNGQLGAAGLLGRFLGGLGGGMMV